GPGVRARSRAWAGHRGAGPARVVITVDTDRRPTIGERMHVDWLRFTLPSLAAAIALTACVDAPPSGKTTDAESGDESSTTDAATDTDTATADTGEPEPYTWYRDVQPIVAEKCGNCHVDGD